MAHNHLGEGARLAAATGAYVCFEDEAGQTLRPPRARTWARRGHTPVVHVSGKGSGRVSIAGLTAYRPGQRPHPFYRIAVHHGRKGERRSLSEADYATLLTAAHHQLHGPVILIWDNLNTHVSKQMRAFLDTHTGWLTVVQLPAYAPDLNAAESVWSLLKRSLGNAIWTSIDDLARTVKTRLKRLQYRPDVPTGCLAQTGLILNPSPP